MSHVTCVSRHVAAPFFKLACPCMPVFPVSPPVASSPSVQMQGFRLGRRSQTLSRRKLHFDASKIGQAAPTNKKLRFSGPALLKQTPIVECGTYGDDFLSFEREQKQETGLSKLAASYRRRGSKQVQENRDENFDGVHDLTCASEPNGIPRNLKGPFTQSPRIVDVSHIDEHGLPSIAVRKRVSRAVNGSSKQRYEDLNAAHHVQIKNTQESRSPDPTMGTETCKETCNSNCGDGGRHTQGSQVVDVAPLAQYANSLDVVPLVEGLLSHAIDTAIVYQGPYPSFSRPSPEECSEVCSRLSQLHGPLEEYAKHKVARISEKQVLALEYHKKEHSKMSKDVQHGPNSTEVQEVFPSGHPRERRTVLDSLVGTMLSHNTTDTNSRRAFASLKAKFPTWEAVYRADPKAVEDAIRCGGLAEIKTSRILNILKALDQERGKLCLEYVRNLSVDEVKLELSRFKGVGPKTIACVLMFHLQQNEFPVDTHVFRITKMLGWVPAKADREKAYLHLNLRIPDHLKFDLHCLFVTHGKRCPRCAKGGRTQKPADGPCPLANINLKFIEASPCDLLIEP